MNTRLWRVKFPGKSFTSRWKPSDNILQRKEDLASFIGGSSSKWPCVGVLLESARIFGPPSLQPRADRRSRLTALLWLLEDIEGADKTTGSDGAGSQDESEECNQWDEFGEYGEDGWDYDCEEIHSLASQAFSQTKDPWPIPEDLELNVWPRHVDHYSVEDTVVWCCKRAASRQLGALQGKRVIRMTAGHHLLGVFVQNLIYGLEATPEGSLEPERVQSLLCRVGAAPAQYADVLPEGSSFDLVLAVMVACFYRQLRGSSCHGALRVPEVLEGLLIAKALCRGQGRCHQLRRSILGLLRRHPVLLGRVETMCRGGSVAMGLDTTNSDHDIFLCLRDGGQDMVEELHRVVLELKETCGRVRLQRAEVVKKDFAVEIKNYYRHRDFDLVPVTFLQSHVGEQQWDPQRQVWQALLHPRLAPKLQLLSEKHPSAFFAMRLVKMWNETLDLRQGKPPLVTLHIPLLTLGAWQSGRLEECDSLQAYLLQILQYIQENWLRQDLGSEETLLRELEVEPHLRRMIAKYGDAMRQDFPRVLEQGLQWLRTASRPRADASAAQLVEGTCRLFGCGQLLSRNPCSR